MKSKQTKTKGARGKREQHRLLVDLPGATWLALKREAANRTADAGRFVSMSRIVSEAVAREVGVLTVR